MPGARAPTRATRLAQPFADPSLSRDAYGYVAENSLYGTYDVHEDGSGVCYGSMLRPILNMRPKFRYRTLGAPARFPADLYQVDWLEQKGIEVDYLTDHDLVAEGVELLRPYTVVVSSSHHEYWTSGMLDSLGDVPRRRRPVHVPRRQRAVRGRERRA